MKLLKLFDYSVQKMVSIAASIATVGFNKEWLSICDFAKICGEEILSDKNWAQFDARVFNLPKEEVCNYMIWRQKDATRNSIQGLGQSNFSQKQLNGKNCNQIQEMLWQAKQINWNDCLTYQKRGACVIKEQYDKDGVTRTRWVVDTGIPIFTQDRDYIEKYL